MAYLYTILVITTIVSLWYKSSQNLESKGRGWFMRNWIGAVIGGFVGFVQAMMLSSDTGLWNLVAVVICLGSLGLALQPLSTDS